MRECASLPSGRGPGEARPRRQPCRPRRWPLWQCRPPCRPCCAALGPAWGAAWGHEGPASVASRWAAAWSCCSAAPLLEHRRNQSEASRALPGSSHRWRTSRPPCAASGHGVTHAPALRDAHCHDGTRKLVCAVGDPNQGRCAWVCSFRAVQQRHPPTSHPEAPTVTHLAAGPRHRGKACRPRTSPGLEPHVAPHLASPLPLAGRCNAGPVGTANAPGEWTANTGWRRPGLPVWPAQTTGGGAGEPVAWWTGAGLGWIVVALVCTQWLERHTKTCTLFKPHRQEWPLCSALVIGGLSYWHSSACRVSCGRSVCPGGREERVG